jgi:hypothetical protein
MATCRWIELIENKTLNFEKKQGYETPEYLFRSGSFIIHF